jgi:predicted dehydrogenase
MQGVELAGVTDVRAGRGEEVAREFGTAFHASVGALADAGAEAVSVAVPTAAHHAIASELIGRGVDVLVEKPIAASVAEARSLVEAAARKGRLLQVGHVERFNGAVIALEKCVREPRFIECHRLSPYPGRGDDVSVVLDLMIHDLDVILALTKSPVAGVDAVGVPIFSKEEDIANARIRFASGCVANVTASRVSIERVRKIRVFSEDAYVSTDYSEQEIIVYRKRPGPMAPGAPPMEWIKVEPQEVTREEPLRLELASFVDCVRTRRRPVVPGEDGLRALELALEILECCRSRAP